MTVTWLNELVVDPVTCRNAPTSDACQYLVHVLQDKYGVPIVDQTLYWAAPNQKCADGIKRSDCTGGTTDPYYGPVPTTAHVHGAHVDYRSDSFPESWYLPKAKNIPKGHATSGRRYSTKGAYPTTKPSNPGSAVYNYDNSQGTSTLFYHDHAMGVTRLNVYAAAGGFWLIRKSKSSDYFLDSKQKFPGPPPIYGQDPNSDQAVRKTIREIPLAIQGVSFYDDGNLFYPANRPYNSKCDAGDVFANTVGMPSIPFLPKSDISPIWNPEAYFSTMVVNGKTWPILEVAPERYRFRLLSLQDSAFLNLLLLVSGTRTELPFYMIGSEQGMLPNVVGVKQGGYTVYDNTKKTQVFTPLDSHQAFLMGPGERYDVIVDFTGFPDTTEIIMYNSAKNEPFENFPDSYEGNFMTNPTGKVMKFKVNNSLKSSKGDKSTPPQQLKLKASPPPNSMKYDRTRDLAMIEQKSKICVTDETCNASTTTCNAGTTSFGPVKVSLGYGQGVTAQPRSFNDPICMNPTNGSTEILHLWNLTPDSHPMHFHLIKFQVIARYKLAEFQAKYNGTNPFTTGLTPIVNQLPWEYEKDMVIAYPNTVTQLRATFDKVGLYVWHCHIVSHEDNEMMLPFCVGKPGVDCPKELFTSAPCPK